MREKDDQELEDDEFLDDSEILEDSVSTPDIRANNGVY